MSDNFAHHCITGAERNGKVGLLEKDWIRDPGEVGEGESIWAGCTNNSGGKHKVRMYSHGCDPGIVPIGKVINHWRNSHDFFVVIWSVWVVGGLLACTAFVCLGFFFLPCNDELVN